ncbi:MAG: DUF971 domain-containing protein [Verrucomicrobiia bacterium]
MAGPRNIQVIGSELAIAWEDGSETYLPLEYLRRGCPCASCGGEPDVLGRLVKPRVSYGEGSFVLRKLEVVGGYALQPTWGDGHSTGLYSWAFLRQLDRLQQSGGGEG